MDRDAWLAWALDWRGVEDPCAACGGSGRRVYPSTATWRGGIGGASMTEDVCDRCWGTGDAQRAGVDLRAWRDQEDARVARRAATLLADRLCAQVASMHPALVALADEVERLGRGRRERPRFFASLCGAYARLLREAATAVGEGGEHGDG